MTTVVTGATGFLGPFLFDAFQALGRTVGVSRHSSTHCCDLTDRAAVRSMMGDLKPDVLVHAAALTDVDQCERNPVLAQRTNCEATANLIEFLPDNATLIYVSTDQVYPSSGAPHAEGNEAPVNVYGSSKLAGEHAAKRWPRSLVLRTNLFGVSRGAGGSSLVDFLVAKFRSREPVSLFTDVLFSPLHVTTMAAFAVECLRRKLTGTFNLGTRDGMSKCDFALAVANHLGLSAEQARRAESVSLPNRAPRPLDMRLDVSRIEQALGRRMPTLADEITKL